MEGDRPPSRSIFSDPVFQSTPSAWRETEWLVNTIAKIAISIHSLRMEGDLPFSAFPFPHPLKFQSTPSAWRETQLGRRSDGDVRISIHSLRMEGDGFPEIHLPLPAYFNPLPPHGGRPSLFSKHFTNVHISIHSLRMEGDTTYTKYEYGERISIHSLRMEGDVFCNPPYGREIGFQSTPSAWRETD